MVTGSTDTAVIESQKVQALQPEYSTGPFYEALARFELGDFARVVLLLEGVDTTGVEGVNRAFEEAAAGELRGILGVTHEKLVSSDFLGDPRSAIVDLPLTQSVGDRLVRVIAWYDNEWGHACRLADLLELVGGGA